MISISFFQNPLVFLMNFISSSPLKVKIVWNKLFRVMSNSIHSIMDKGNAE